MKKFRVYYAISVLVEAEDERQAEDLANIEFNSIDTTDLLRRLKIFLVCIHDER